MFTGLVGSTGVIKDIVKRFSGAAITVESSGLSGIAIGNSAAVDGVCLTVIKAEKAQAAFDVVRHTYDTTTLKDKRLGDRVNIELALKAGDSIGGHFVSGHVDCVGRIERVLKGRGDMELRIAIPRKFAELVVEKGSIAIDGTSLTIAKIKEDRVMIYVIPHTMNATTLGSKKAGDEVNIEFDMMMKQAARNKEISGGLRITEDLLRDRGLI